MILFHVTGKLVIFDLLFLTIIFFFFSHEYYYALLRLDANYSKRPVATASSRVSPIFTKYIVLGL